MRRPSPWRSAGFPRGAAPFGARARLIARLAVHARRDARRRPPGEGSRRKGKGGGALRVTCSLFVCCCRPCFSLLPRVRTERRLPVCVSNRLPLHALGALSTADRLDYHQPISSTPSPLRPWQQQHRFRSLAPRCTAFCFPPGRRKESGARAQGCGRTSISDPRGGVLCDDVPAAWLTRRGGSRQTVLLLPLACRRFPGACKTGAHFCAPF